MWRFLGFFKTNHKSSINNPFDLQKEIIFAGIVRTLMKNYVESLFSKYIGNKGFLTIIILEP